VIRLAGTGSDSDPCVIEVHGRRLGLADIPVIAQSVRGGVELTFGPTTPYRCVGGVVFALQRAGVERIGFSPESPLNR